MIIYLKEILASDQGPKLDPNKNYCTDCGACCNYFKVAFKKEERQSLGGQVPDEFVQKYDRKNVTTIGRDKFKSRVRCKALEGGIGTQVSCRMYENRPSVCRAFEVISPQGVQNPRCKRAREFYGLPGQLMP